MMDWHQQNLQQFKRYCLTLDAINQRFEVVRRRHMAAHRRSDTGLYWCLAAMEGTIVILGAISDYFSIEPPPTADR